MPRASEIRLKNVHILLNLKAEYQLSLYVDVSQSGTLVKKLYTFNAQYYMQCNANQIGNLCAGKVKK
jgi:hypothetical protein